MAAYGAALKGYHVVAIFFDHPHGSTFYQWNGIDCYNVGSTAHSLRCFEVNEREVKMIDIHSRDHWQTWQAKVSSRSVPPPTWTDRRRKGAVQLTTSGAIPAIIVTM